MARPCTICTHPEVNAINYALINEAGFERIVEKFGVSLGSLHRHNSKCLPPLITIPPDSGKIVETDQKSIKRGIPLLTRMENLIDLINSVFEKAKDHEPEVKLNALREIGRRLDSMAKMLGMTGPDTQVNIQVNINEHPDWIALKARLVTALDKYPDAKLAVIEAISESQ